MDSTCDKRILKLDCLRLANTNNKYDDEGRLTNLSADEVVAAATKFYEFLTVEKKDN